jgi:hypothetical protein
MQEAAVHIPRKRRSIGVLLILLASAGCTGAPAPATPPALVGAWRSRAQFSSGAFAPIKDLELLYVFNLGGTMTESSNYDQLPPVPPAYGEWRQTGPGLYEARYTFFTTRPPAALQALATPSGGWAPSGYGTLVERIELTSDGRSYASTIQLELFDQGGKLVEGGGSAQAHGTRTGF